MTTNDLPDRDLWNRNMGILDGLQPIFDRNAAEARKQKHERGIYSITYTLFRYRTQAACDCGWKVSKKETRDAEVAGIDHLRTESRREREGR